MNNRQKQILNIIDDKEIVSLQELVVLLDVSEATIRRDLTLLEEKNLIYRTHGGATRRTATRGVEPSIIAKKSEYVLDKKQVAKYVCQNFVKSGETIYLDAGTSTYDMIDYLKDKNITVVTNSVYHLNKLIQNKIHTILLGGVVKHSTYAIVGATSLEQIKKYSFDACFMGCNGIDHIFGLSTADENEAYLKNEALKNSKNKFILADVSKFGHRKFHKFADMEMGKIISYKVPADFRKYSNIIVVEEEENK